MFKLEEEKDQVDKKATSSCFVDTSMSCASKVQGGAVSSTDAYTVIREELRNKPAQKFDVSFSSDFLTSIESGHVVWLFFFVHEYDILSGERMCRDGVIRTDKWLNESNTSPITLCKKLTSYFPKEASERNIYQHLKMHGMYRTTAENMLDRLPKNIWEKVGKMYETLQKEWSGPQVPIFIFPADETNVKIRREFNGKSGLAFRDKLFLFFSNHNTNEEIKAVLTHEYNHVCRLKKHQKAERNYTLLDAVLLEGMAENAVREYCGESALASWTTYYTDERLLKIVEQIIIPNRNLKRNEKKHSDILYGNGFYPKMSGYCAGYYLVKKYLNSTNLSTRAILGKDSIEFVKEYI